MLTTAKNKKIFIFGGFYLTSRNKVTTENNSG
jgi:hypothetical protein